MQKNEKNLVAGIVIGAALTAVTIVFITGRVCKSITDMVLAPLQKEAHLFNMNEQEGKEEVIDSLIPDEDKHAPQQPAEEA